MTGYTKQRIELIHKGNAIFNKGDIPLAERFFRAARYQDGLIRVAQHFFAKKNWLKSADVFRSANYLKGEYACYAKMGILKDMPNTEDSAALKKASDEMNKKFAKVIQKLLAEDK